MSSRYKDRRIVGRMGGELKVSHSPLFVVIITASGVGFMKAQASVPATLTVSRTCSLSASSYNRKLSRRSLKLDPLNPRYRWLLDEHVV